MSDIIRFEVAKINRGKERICICEEPHYVIDTVNRLVTCEDCGAVIDAFDVLVNFVEHMEQIEQRQKQMKQQWQAYAKLAKEEFERMIRNRAFREMNSKYPKGLYPVCPECGELFDPAAIGRWSKK